MLVGLTGYAGSGKDTAALGLIEDGWERISFAEPLRQMLLVLDPMISLSGTRLKELVMDRGWEAAKKFPETRRLMQVLGTEVGRDMIDSELWTKLAFRDSDRKTNLGKSVVFTDCRFPNEVREIRCRGGKIIRIHREGLKPAHGHVSDTNVDLLSADREIINNGSPEDLQNTLRETLKTLFFTPGTTTTPNP